jgi:uncharacterized damage-inducible protein DinB
METMSATGAVMTPEQASFLLNVLMPSVENEYEKTRRVLAAVPPGKCQYRPHPDSRSALELVWHIASCDLWFLDGFLLQKFEMEDDSMPADFKDSSEILAWYEDCFPGKLGEVKKLPPDFWATPLPFFGIYNYPAVMYLQFMICHTVHHRGQLAAYLRPMGAKVPCIYGGSFDEPMEPPCESE